MGKCVPLVLGIGESRSPYT